MPRLLGLSIIFTASILVACGGRTMFGTAECGNLEAEWGEECDGADLNGVTCADLGWSGGSLACAAGCTYETSGCSGSGPVCGNGALEYGEQCDGADLGGQSCVSLGVGSGTLGCHPCGESIVGDADAAAVALTVEHGEQLVTKAVAP